VLRLTQADFGSQCGGPEVCSNVERTLPSLAEALASIPLGRSMADQGLNLQPCSSGRNKLPVTGPTDRSAARDQAMKETVATVHDTMQTPGSNVDDPLLRLVKNVRGRLSQSSAKARPLPSTMAGMCRTEQHDQPIGSSPTRSFAAACDVDLCELLAVTSPH